MTECPKGAEGILIIESSESMVALHSLCVYAYIICCAKNLTPVFLEPSKQSSNLKIALSRYFDKFEVVPLPKLSRAKCFGLFLVSMAVWINQIFKRNLILIQWRGEGVGDIVYDQYLAAFKRGGLRYSDIRLVKIIYLVIRDVERNHCLFDQIRPVAVLLSHRVGLSAAPTAVVCQKEFIPIYSFGGGEYGTMIASPTRKSYEYRTTLPDLEPWLNLPRQEFDRLFESIQDELFKGSYNADSKLAFANKLFSDRQEFASTFGLDAAKKNIFVMLHAFTDYPHSHFNGMLFADFLDWFLKTLEFASRNKNVNWIFKQHPAAHFYPVVDVDWDALVRKYTSDNLIFMPQGSDFDSRSICNVGDATITCVGSAGFEFSALGRIPTITAGDNPYADAGFAVYPKTQAHYFDVLRNLHTLPKLDDEVWKKAKATFMFIHRLSRVPMHAFLNLSHAESRQLQHGDAYFAKIDVHAAEHEELIALELQKYIAVVAAPGFGALRSSPQEY